MAKKSIAIYSIFLGLFGFGLIKKSRADREHCRIEYGLSRPVRLPLDKILSAIGKDPQMFKTAAGFYVGTGRAPRYLGVDPNLYSRQKLSNPRATLEKNLGQAVRSALQSIPQLDPKTLKNYRPDLVRLMGPPVVCGVQQAWVTIQRHTQMLFPEDFDISVGRIITGYPFPADKKTLFAAEIQYALRKHVVALPLVRIAFNELNATRVKIWIRYEATGISGSPFIEFDRAPFLPSPPPHLHQNYLVLRGNVRLNLSAEIDEEFRNTGDIQD